MKDYTYEVRGVNDPIEGEVVRFHSQAEALNYSDEMKSLYPDNTVYMVEWEFDDEFGFDGAPTKTQEMQIRGPEVDANLADSTVPNSCDGDCSANYDDEGNFRLPKYDDGLDDEPVDEAWGLEADKRKAQSAHILKTNSDFSYDLNHTDDPDPTPIDQDSLVQAEDTVATLDNFVKSLDEDTEEGLVGVDDIPVDESLNEGLLSAIKNIIKKLKPKKQQLDQTDQELLTKLILHDTGERSLNIKGMTDHYLKAFINMANKYKVNDLGIPFQKELDRRHRAKNESLDPDDIENESFAEELFSALSDKRDERVFPDGKLDLEAPHKDVPVVNCKVNPAITHAEDEKPLVEAADRSGEFYDALEDNSPAQMYVAREIVYDLVYDAKSAEKLADWGTKALELEEQLALDSLIADALEGANEHEAMMDYMHNRTLPVTLSFELDKAGKKTMNALIASCKSKQEKLKLLLQAINFLVLDGYLD